MTNAELRDAAVAELQTEGNELRETTRGLKGFSPPSSSHWGKALAARNRAIQYLARIGEVVEPPPSTGIEYGVKCEGWFTAADIDGQNVANKNPTGLTKLGAKRCRLEWSPKAASSLDSPMGLLANAGIEVRPLLFNTHGRVPTSSEVQTLKPVAERFGPGGTFWQGRTAVPIRFVEFLNETGGNWYFGNSSYTDAAYKQRARDYGVRALEACDLLAPFGIGLLVQADEVSPDGMWVAEMLSAAPRLKTAVAGWTIHPYGTYQAGARWYGRDRIERTMQKLAANGETTKSFWFTEYGIASDDGNSLSDNYGLPTNMTYSQCADELIASEAMWKQVCGARLKHVDLYTQWDGAAHGASNDREAYFGLFRRDSWQEKGRYTAEAKKRLAA